MLNDEGGTEHQLAAAAQRRKPAARVPLANDPTLDATLDELDTVLDADGPEAYLAPPPLIARLAVPLPSGRWSQGLHPESASSYSAAPISEANLRELDEEWHNGVDGADSIAPPPPLNARLPGPTGALARKAVNQWMVSVTLILLMFAGAAAGALVFRERLSDIVDHWQTRLK